MAFITRQSIEGDILISTENVAGSEATVCWIQNGNYVPNSLALVINGTTYPVANPQSTGFGVFQVLSPVPIKAGDQIKLKSLCSADESQTVTALSINLKLVTGTSPSTCQNVTNVKATFEDRVRLFFQGNNQVTAGVNIKLNGNNLNRSDFSLQLGSQGVITSANGDFSTNNNDNAILFSNNLYAPVSTLRVTILQASTYQTVRLGYLEVIMALGQLKYIDYINGGSEENIGTYGVNDVIQIVSNGNNYIIQKNGSPLYTAAKNITFVLPSGAGSIAPNPAVAGVDSLWTLPSNPGTYSIGVKIGQGVNAQANAVVVPCRLTANNVTAPNAEKGSENNPVGTLNGSAPANCAISGFKILSLPTCGTLKLNSASVALNQVISVGNAGNLLIDIPMGCSESDLSFTYSSVSNTTGCQESLPATVSISLEEIPVEPEPECDICKMLADIMHELKCIRADQKKILKRP